MTPDDIIVYQCKIILKMKLLRHLRKLRSDLAATQATKLELNKQLDQIDQKTASLLNQDTRCPHLLNARDEEMKEILRLRDMKKQYREMYIRKTLEEEKIQSKISRVEDKSRAMALREEHQKESNELEELIRLSSIFRKHEI